MGAYLINKYVGIIHRFLLSRRFQSVKFLLHHIPDSVLYVLFYGSKYMEGLMTHFHERNFVNCNVIVRSSAFFFRWEIKLPAGHRTSRYFLYIAVWLNKCADRSQRGRPRETQNKKPLFDHLLHYNQIHLATKTTTSVLCGEKLKCPDAVQHVE